MGKLFVILAVVIAILLLLRGPINRKMATAVSPGAMTSVGQPTPTPRPSMKPDIVAACQRCGVELVSFTEDVSAGIVEIVVRARDRNPIMNVPDDLLNQNPPLLKDYFQDDFKSWTTIEQAEAMNYAYHKMRVYR